MNNQYIIEFLTKYNEWRRFDGEPDDESPKMPEPAEIGLVIDIAIEKISKIEKKDRETKELLSIIKDCLSYADAQAVLRGGEALELRDKCRAVIEKMELWS